MPGYNGSSATVKKKDTDNEEQLDNFLDYNTSNISSKLNIIMILLAIISAIMLYNCLFRNKK